ncbi:hypothetical protein [uncultured Microbacterium sp.]|uniref:hypothetical protein n=1 Tax=uncultured Microbacterium sp. TaxID=191216 RepID=UPI002631391D|nr:hypothetical protein [uncultured Microbacterium sp.]
MHDEQTVNAEPAGGWTSAEAADGQTEQNSADAAQRVQEESPDVEISDREETDPVSAASGAAADPDLLTDDQAAR